MGTVRECSDEEHLSLLAAGDMQHLGPLYRRWRQRVVAHCYSLVGDEQLAADLCHDVFLRVTRYAHSFRGDAAFGTWLYTTVRRVCLDHVKKQQRSQTVLGQVQRQGRQSVQATPEIQRLRRAFECLAPEQREILVLHRFHGWKLREIAQQMNTSEGAMKVRAHRALQALRMQFHQMRSPEDE